MRDYGHAPCSREPVGALYGHPSKDFAVATYAHELSSSAVLPEPRRGSLLAPGVVLADKYRLSHKTGTGGMGTVWAALNLATGAEVAVKLLLPEHAHYDEAVARFRHEAHATAQLTHRGIVRIFDLIEFGGSNRSIAIVMELLHGRTLAA